MTRLIDAVKERFSGTGNARKVMILDQAMHNQVSPRRSRAIGLAAGFSTEELARIYQVRPPLVGIWDHSSFTNSQDGRDLVFAGFHAVAVDRPKLEAGLWRDRYFAGSPSYLNSTLAAYCAGPSATLQSLHIASRNHILRPNEIRGLEGFNPIEAATTSRLSAADLNGRPPRGSANSGHKANDERSRPALHPWPR